MLEPDQLLIQMVQLGVVDPLMDWMLRSSFLGPLQYLAPASPPRAAWVPPEPAIADKRMRKLILSVVVLLLVTFGGLLWWVTRTVWDHMITSQAASVKLLDEMDFVCPPGTAKIRRPWGKAGWMLFCESDGAPHGPWLAAENGRLEIRGQYRDGERDGVWEWYNVDGAVEKKLTYDDREGERPTPAEETIALRLPHQILVPHRIEYGEERRSERSLSPHPVPCQRLPGSSS